MDQDLSRWKWAKPHYVSIHLFDQLLGFELQRQDIRFESILIEKLAWSSPFERPSTKNEVVRHGLRLIVI